MMLPIVLAACLTLPIALFSVLDYPVNPSFALAPLVAWAAFTQLRSLAILLYSIVAASGLAACLIANAIAPDGELIRHILSVVLLLFPISYVFLGCWVASRYSVQETVRWLAIFSALFGIALAVRLMLIGEPFRVYVGPLGLAELNALFLGLPVVFSAGVLSLAHLLLIQSALCLFGIFGKVISPVERGICAIGFACLVVLILKSEARSAQGGLVILAIALVWGFVKFNPKRIALIGGASALIVLGIFLTRGNVAERLVETTSVVVEGSQTTTFEKGDSPVANVANGRVQLIHMALDDITYNPWIGTGFGKWGRFSGKPVTDAVKASSSTHIYFLTVLWKGGLLFAVPMALFFALWIWKVGRNARLILNNPERSFAAIAVISALAMSVFWDILNVPSAGSLAFFLVGILAAPPFPVGDKSHN